MIQKKHVRSRSAVRNNQENFQTLAKIAKEPKKKRGPRLSQARESEEVGSNVRGEKGGGNGPIRIGSEGLGAYSKQKERSEAETRPVRNKERTRQRMRKSLALERGESRAPRRHRQHVIQGEKNRAWGNACR